VTADEFNDAHPVGTPVIAYPCVRPEDPVAPSLCKRVETRTRTLAWRASFGRDVVMVEDHASWIALSHIDVVDGAR
jgi:hypothetical protein